MLWIPGPTHVRPEILRELALPMIGHRSSAMSAIIERIDPGLRLAFGLADGSRSVVAVGSHAASGMMEGALHGAGVRVLSVVNGAFSARWREIAEILGKQVTALELPWGEAVSAERLREALVDDGPYDAVTLVVNETSTGVRTPLEPVAAALRELPETLLLVDVVSALGGFPIDFDANRVDFALAGVNKALALPPGITALCASERYMARARFLERPSWYLDPVRLVEGHLARKTPATPCIPHFRALARQLEDITVGATLPASDRGVTGAEAWTARYAVHARMRERTLAWAEGRGLEPFPPRALSSPTVTCLAAGGVDVPALLRGLKERGQEIGNGYGKLKDETFRIGHMGDHTEAELDALLAAMDEVLGPRAA
jgi:aspartate aminotransferase-like enzyme